MIADHETTTHLDLRHLRAFVAVAEELHFTRAAERLHLAQQALSGQIRQLEDSLGTQLFTRTTRKVELTGAGRALLTHAMPILASVATAWDETTRAGDGDLGRLAISYPPTARHHTLPVILDEFHRRYPGVRVRTCELWWQAASVEAVAGGRVDVGLSRCPIGLGEDIECVPIREHPLGVILGTGHRLAGLDVVPIEALRRETLVIWPREFSPGFFDRVVAALESHGFTGSIRELENLGNGLLMSDPVGRAEVAGCRAFGISFSNLHAPLPESFVWRVVEPEVLMPLHLFWRRSAGPVVQNFAALALELAERERWLAQPTGVTT